MDVGWCSIRGRASPFSKEYGTSSPSILEGSLSYGIEATVDLVSDAMLVVAGISLVSQTVADHVDDNLPGGRSMGFRMRVP